MAHKEAHLLRILSSWQAQPPPQDYTSLRAVLHAEGLIPSEWAADLLLVSSDLMPGRQPGDLSMSAEELRDLLEGMTQAHWKIDKMQQRLLEAVDDFVVGSEDRADHELCAAIHDVSDAMEAYEEFDGKRGQTEAQNIAASPELLRAIASGLVDEQAGPPVIGGLLALLHTQVATNDVTKSRAAEARVMEGLVKVFQRDDCDEAHPSLLQCVYTIVDNPQACEQAIELGLMSTLCEQLQDAHSYKRTAGALWNIVTQNAQCRDSLLGQPGLASRLLSHGAPPFGVEVSCLLALIVSHTGAEFEHDQVLFALRAHVEQLTRKLHGGVDSQMWYSDVDLSEFVRMCEHQNDVVSLVGTVQLHTALQGKQQHFHLERVDLLRVRSVLLSWLSRQTVEPAQCVWVLPVGESVQYDEPPYWTCGECSNVNWARGVQCNRCGISKPLSAPLPSSIEEETDSRSVAGRVLAKLPDDQGVRVALAGGDECVVPFDRVLPERLWHSTLKFWDVLATGEEPQSTDRLRPGLCAWLRLCASSLMHPGGIGASLGLCGGVPSHTEHNHHCFPARFRRACVAVLVCKGKLRKLRVDLLLLLVDDLGPVSYTHLTLPTKRIV
eukprot:TRINITY_DN12818_c0_g1_i2.p1 TRINITY_DN12818_c0_g1~~TRINITY_DN12818_c0_g1_i2.p1  ORF type:complete len:608 (-),score=104.03 TRINITY_DN12818_c0_g1_i2:104-1927(-)